MGWDWQVLGKVVDKFWGSSGGNLGYLLDCFRGVLGYGLCLTFKEVTMRYPLCPLAMAVEAGVLDVGTGRSLHMGESQGAGWLGHSMKAERDIDIISPMGGWSYPEQCPFPFDLLCAVRD